MTGPLALDAESLYVELKNGVRSLLTFVPVVMILGFALLSVFNVFGMIATLLFLSIDGHLLLISALVDSFNVVPVGQGSLAQFSWSHLALLGSNLFSLGLQIALPVLCTMLLVNLALGVMARAAPIPLLLIERSQIKNVALQVVFQRKPSPRPADGTVV